jgi:hypothetical protein
MNAARYFQRREDYQPPQTPSDSPFRRFKVNCLKCNSCRLRVIDEFDAESGEVKVYLFCPQCREREAMPIGRSQPFAPNGKLPRPAQRGEGRGEGI